MKQELTKPGDADPGVPGPERRANYLKLGVLVLASGFAAYIAVWIAMNVVSPFPLEFRENAVLFTAELQNQGENPYALEYRPVIVNVYGIGYYWICYPFTRLFGCSYTVLRLVSCAFILATCCLLMWALRIDGVSWLFAVVAALFLFVQLGQGLSIVARPDSLGLFLFLASLVIPYRFRFSYPSLFCNALLAILGFLTKPYFLLGLCLVWLCVFLFDSKYKAVVFGTVAGLGLTTSIWMINLIYECYFTETFFAPMASAIHSWAHLGKIGGLFLVQNVGLLLVLAAGLFHRAVRRRAEIRRAMQQGTKIVFEKWFAGSTGDPPVPSGDSPDGTGAKVRANGHGLFATLFAAVPVGGSPTGAGGSPAPPIFKTGSKRGWFNWNQFHQPLVGRCGDLAGLALVCNTAVIVLVLGLHPGNDILYYHQLITPFLLWKVVRLADTTFKQHSLACTLLLVNLLIIGSAAAPLPADRTAHWRALESLVASSSDVFAAPHLALLARQSGRTVYDAGQTEYAFAADHRNFTRVSRKYRERNQLFLQDILTKMRNRRFDLILINPGICPFLPLEELRRYYTPTRVLAAPMPFDSYLRQFPLVQWIPNERPPTSEAHGVQH